VAYAAAARGGGVDVGALVRLFGKWALVGGCRRDGRMGVDGTGAREGVVWFRHMDIPELGVREECF
jgi:hypothetical protein